MDEAAGAAVDQRQDGRDGGKRRRAQRQRLDKGDTQREARLGVVGQALARRTVDQGVEVGQAAQRFGGDGMSEGAVVGPGELARGAVERRLEGQALAEDRVEQPQRGAAGRDAGGVGLAAAGAGQCRGTSGLSALPLRTEASTAVGGE